MAVRRPTQRELRAVKHANKREEMELAISEGRMTVRQMTAKERVQADHDRTRVRTARAARRTHLAAPFRTR